MPVYARTAGEWVDSTPFGRDAGAYTDSQSPLYARSASTWELIYPDPAAVGAMLPVEALAVTAGPTDNSVSIGWTNPTQPSVEPTAVQVRIAELGAVWDESAVPLSAWAWSALSPSTTYVAQVRYVRRDGLSTTYSAIKHVEFTTTAAPVGPPAPDPGGSGGDTIFPIDIGIGGGGAGTGDPVGTSDGCWYEYEIEIVPLDSMGWITTGITGTFSGALSEFSYDLSLLDPTRVYRLCVRTACDTDADTIADDFGDWECGDPFPGLADWGAICGGINDSPDIVALDAVDDAVFRFPEFCLDAEGDSLVLTDAVSGVIVGKGPGFQSYFVDATGECGVTPLAAQTAAPFYATMLAPIADLGTILDVNGDWTLMTRFRALTSHSGSNGRVVVDASYGAFAANFKLTESATGWTPSATVLTSDGVETITGTEIPFDDTVTHTITMRWDDDDEFQLWVDGLEDGTAVNVSATTIYETVTTTGVVTSNAAGVVNMQQLGWDRALTDDEIGSFSGDTYSTERVGSGTDSSAVFAIVGLDAADVAAGNGVNEPITVLFKVYFADMTTYNSGGFATTHGMTTASVSYRRDASLDQTTNATNAAFAVLTSFSEDVVETFGDGTGYVEGSFVMAYNAGTYSMKRIYGISFEPTAPDPLTLLGEDNVTKFATLSNEGRTVGDDVFAVSWPTYNFGTTY